MKKRVLKWTGGTLVALIGLYVAADSISARYLKRYGERYQQEVAEIKRREAEYRRPMVFDDSIEQNAAAWYRLALPRFTGTTFEELAPVLKAGAEGYGTAVTPVITEKCAASRSERVMTALRCTHCNWELGFDIGSLNAFGQSHEAIVLAKCLTIDGHQAAHDGHLRDAAKFYLEGIAVGCDLGAGNDVMNIAGAGNVLTGLDAIAKMVARIDDATLLGELSRDVTKLEGRLPDQRHATRRTRLWLENALALDELEVRGERFIGFARITPWRILAGVRLRSEDALLREIGSMETITNRAEGTNLAERLKLRGGHSRSDLVRRETGGLARAATIPFDLLAAYQATQASIALQQWWIEHRSYPLDALSLNLSAEVRYESVANGRGYKLIGPRSTLVDRTPD